MPTSIEHLQAAYRQAMETAAMLRRQAKERFLVNDADHEAWAEDRLRRAAEREQAAQDYAELMGWKS